MRTNENEDYEELYSSSQQHDLEYPAFNIFFFLTKNNIPQLDTKVKEACEKLITIEEANVALNNLGKTNKSPGIDDFNCWILSIVFWNYIGQDLVLSLNYIMPSPKANWECHRKEYY